MLDIKYNDGHSDHTISYKSPQDFVANQQLEVPDLEDYYEIKSATVDGKTVDLTDSTISGLYNLLEEEYH
ncbi:hypothetical protein [Lentilactobacillus sp. Marseille-Q4993]|uniref:hypothetical protein n=1 Tax=Lentilactobacillus sp. Marseille-Q4993 TaxID=3039492 RepID=UPI0024BCE415|nr:hypothetical protein [Lentilactobacillus sp. Marseille-Q4993]